MNTTDTASQVGVTYRQLDHWIRQGYIHAEAPGSGNPRQLSSHETKVLRHMAALVNAGVDAGRAATYARRLARGRAVKLGPWQIEPLP